MQAGKYDEGKISSLWPSVYPSQQETVLGGTSEVAPSLLRAVEPPPEARTAVQPETEEPASPPQPVYLIPDDGVSRIAEKGLCPYCDRRRVYHAKVAKKSRDKVKG